MEPITNWLVAFMLAHAPTTVPSELDRYHEIAQDIVGVVSDTAPLYEGRDARVRTAGLLASIMWHESGFKAEVDHGGYGRRNVCLMQVGVGRGRTQEGWSASDLIRHRRHCVEAGLRIARQSFEACRGLPESGRLRAYVSGSCRRGQRPSLLRVQTAKAWYTRQRPTFDDKVFLEPSSMVWDKNQPVVPWGDSDKVN